MWNIKQLLDANEARFAHLAAYLPEDCPGWLRKRLERLGPRLKRRIQRYESMMVRAFERSPEHIWEWSVLKAPCDRLVDIYCMESEVRKLIERRAPVCLIVAVSLHLYDVALDRFREAECCLKEVWLKYKPWREARRRRWLERNRRQT